MRGGLVLSTLRRSRTGRGLVWPALALAAAEEESRDVTLAGPDCNDLVTSCENPRRREHLAIARRLFLALRCFAENVLVAARPVPSPSLNAWSGAWEIAELAGWADGTLAAILCR